MTMNDKHQASTTAERHTVTVSADEKHAQVSIAGATGHHSPGERTAVASDALDDERLARTEHLLVSAPRGDTEVLDEVRSRLEPSEIRQAGATILIEGRHRDRSPADPGDVPARDEGGLSDPGSPSRP